LKVTSRREPVGKNPRILKSGQMDDSFYLNLWNTIWPGTSGPMKFRTVKRTGGLTQRRWALRRCVPCPAKSPTLQPLWGESGSPKLGNSHRQMTGSC